MDQFRCEFKARQFPDANRRTTSEEMLEVKHYTNALKILYKPVS